MKFKTTLSLEELVFAISSIRHRYEYSMMKRDVQTVSTSQFIRDRSKIRSRCR